MVLSLAAYSIFASLGLQCARHDDERSAIPASSLDVVKSKSYVHVRRNVRRWASLRGVVSIRFLQAAVLTEPYISLSNESGYSWKLLAHVEAHASYHPINDPWV
jgi:hypothetical protein